MQTAALYDPRTAERMLASDNELDLHSACALGLYEDVGRLCSTEALALEADWLPPIGFALLRSQRDSLQALLDHGDDPNRLLRRIGFFVWEMRVLEEAKWRPIHMAAVHGYDPAASTLIGVLADYGADLEAPSCLGDRAIHLACTYGWDDVIRTLLQLGVDVNSTTTQTSATILAQSSPENTQPDGSFTPMMVAARESKSKTIELLLQQGANVHATSVTGKTALHMAADGWWQEDVACVDVLLDAGADAAALDEHGKTAADYARTRNYHGIVERLARAST